MYLLCKFDDEGVMSVLSACKDIGPLNVSADLYLKKDIEAATPAWQERFKDWPHEVPAVSVDHLYKVIQVPEWPEIA